MTGLACYFQKRLAAKNQTPWSLSTTEDYRYRLTDGGFISPIARLKHAWLNQIFRLTTKDVEVRKAFLLVQGMIKSPVTLIHPKIVVKVVLQTLTETFSGTNDAQSLKNREMMDAKIPGTQI